MANTINGIGKPMFSAVHPVTGVVLRGNAFPYCMIGGLKAEYAKDSIVTELESGALVQDVNGYRNKYILDYSTKLDGEYCLDLQRYVNLEQQGYTILFRPHVDTPEIEEKVIFSNGSFLLQLLASAGKFVSMQGIVIELTATTLQPIQWVSSIEPLDPQPIHAMEDLTAIN